jgi:hypothetical protein
MKATLHKGWKMNKIAQVALATTTLAVLAIVRPARADENAIWSATISGTSVDIAGFGFPGNNTYEVFACGATASNYQSCNHAFTGVVSTGFGWALNQSVPFPCISGEDFVRGYAYIIDTATGQIVDGFDSGTGQRTEYPTFSAAPGC